MYWAGRGAAGATHNGANDMTRTQTDGRIEYSGENTDRGAVRDHGGHTCFGRWEAGRFVVAHYPRSRSYKTDRGAERAIAKWIDA